MRKNNKQFLISILMLVMGMNIFAQTSKFEMAGSFGSSAADEPRFAITDQEGNYYVVGFASGDVAFSPEISLTGRGGGDAILVKYDSDMNVKWARFVGGAGSESFESVAVSSNGDIYVVGKVGSMSLIDGTDATISPANAQDGMVVVYDKDGNYKTHQTISGTGNAIAYSIVIDAMDNVYIAGSTIGNTAFGNDKNLNPVTENAVIYVAKYNAALACQWVIEGNSDNNTSDANWSLVITLDKDQNLFVGGRYNTKINIIGTNGNVVSNTTAGSSTGFISKINAAGECQWIKAISCAGNRIDMKGIASDSKGNVGVIGFSNEKVTPEGGAEYTFGGNMDIFFVRMSASGTYVDGFAYGGAGRDEGKSIFFDNNDHVYLAGNMNGAATSGTTINMNPKGSTAADRTFYGHDGFFAKYNGETLDLIQVEKTTTPSKAAQHEVAFNVTMSRDFCRVYVLGYFNNGQTIFDGDNGTLTLPHAGNYDFYWTTYSSCFSIKTKELPAGVKGEIYYASIEVTNQTGKVNYSITDGTLPGGLQLDAEGNISGTPSETGNFEFTIRVADELSSKEKKFAIFVSAGEGCDLFIVSDACPDAHLGVAYSFQFEIRGEAFVCSVTGGKLPDGLSLSPSGLLSGTPTGEEGIYTFTVQAKSSETCMDELEVRIIVDSKTAIDQVELLSDFNLYPIPAESEFTVDVSFNNAVNARVSIISPLALTLWEKDYFAVETIQETIPAGNLASGIYFVVVKTDEAEAVRKLIIR